MRKIINKLKSEKANSLVENVIVLPIIFIVIYFLILAAFIIHDRSTMDAAAKRGSIYAARCISDPNYSEILRQSGNEAGTLDFSVDTFSNASFKGIGNNVKAYRYLNLDSRTIKNEAESEVYSIVEKTKLPWRDIKPEDIVVTIDNKIIYQNINVAITATYPMPALFGAFGLPTEFEYTVNSTTAVNDPDEFIRNVDLVIDLCVELDEKTGSNISKVTQKIGDMAGKLKEFLKVKN